MCGHVCLCGFVCLYVSCVHVCVYRICSCGESICVIVIMDVARNVHVYGCGLACAHVYGCVYMFLYVPIYV